jgi:hypothetical protein
MSVSLEEENFVLQTGRKGDLLDVGLVCGLVWHFPEDQFHSKDEPK